MYGFAVRSTTSPIILTRYEGGLFSQIDVFYKRLVLSSDCLYVDCSRRVTPFLFELL